MESKTKVTLSGADLQRLVARAFGPAAVRDARELADGWFNTAYLLRLAGDPGEVVLKVGPPAEADILAYESDILRAEVETMKLAAANPAIPVPTIYYDDFSRRLLPYDYYFMAVVPGTPWDLLRESLSAAQNALIESELGRITRQINGFENPTFGYYASPRRFTAWRDAFRWMCTLLFADARRYGITLALDEQTFLAYFDRHQAIFAEVTQPRLVHWDLWAGNIFIDLEGENPRIAGIIDFERALWGDPLMESYHGHQSSLDAYFAGYGAHLLDTPSKRLRRIFYNIYLYLIMIIEDGPRQYDDKRGVEWARESLARDLALLRAEDVLDVI